MQKLAKITVILFMSHMLLSCSSAENEGISNPVTGTYLRMEESGNFITSFIVIDVDGVEYEFEHEYTSDWEGNFDGNLDATEGKHIKIDYDEFVENWVHLIVSENESPTEEIDPEWRKITGIFSSEYTIDDIGSDLPQEFVISTQTQDVKFPAYLSPEDFNLIGETVTVYYSSRTNRYATRVEVL